MKKTIVVLGIIVAVLVVGGAAWALTKDKDKTDSNTNTGSTTPAADSSGVIDSAPPTDGSESAAVITYTDDGFSPVTLTVKAGTVVTVKNESSSTLDFASDDHPTHKINSDLNVGDIEPGKSATFTAKVGTWGYHNHLNANDAGTLTVE